MKTTIILLTFLFSITIFGFENNSPSVSNILNPDGTVQLGTNGSFNPAGYKMNFTETCAPKFVSETQPLNTNTAMTPGWDPNFFDPNGVNNSVFCFAVLGSDLYVGGAFLVVGGQNINYIAKWNGSSWSSVGTGMNNFVYSLAVSGTDLYAGGLFTTAGGISANRIAKWNGSTWSALGTGMNGIVRALTIVGADLYAGGEFTTAGGISSNRIAKWNGSTWSALGTGTDNAVWALASIGADLYAGGTFTNAGGSPANYIAKWNGSSWSAIGTGMNNSVFAFAVNGSDLYAGGFFTLAGGNTANRIAKWDGSAWSTLGSGLSGQANSLVFIGSTLYAGGGFGSAGGIPANNLASWDGTNWNYLGASANRGVNNVVQALCVYQGSLYFGGLFSGNINLITGIIMNRIGIWNGSQLLPVHQNPTGFGVNAQVNSVCYDGTNIYVGGQFFSAGNNTSAKYIAMFDGASYSAVGGGTDNLVSDMIMHNGELIVGGQFLQAGGVTRNYIARWNGTAWNSFGSGVGSFVNCLASDGTNIYAGGYFSTAGGVPANCVAKWNGSSWSALGSGLNGYAWSMTMMGSDLYVGGGFTTAGGVSVNRIAKWDGSNWSALGSGMNGEVHSFAVNGSDLFAGGFFTLAGGISANRIAKWNGSSWSAVGLGCNGGVLDISFIGSDMYVGGAFSQAGGGLVVNKIAKWNGSNWSALIGGGTSVGFGSVNSLSVAGSDLYVGGYFDVAGSTNSYNFAKYNEVGVMSYVSSTTTQSVTSSVDINSKNNQIIGIEIIVSGTANPLSVTSFTLNTNGSNQTGNFHNRRIFYTGNSGVFDTINQFGVTYNNPPLGNTVTNGNQQLQQGTNYFWVTYDIYISASQNHVVDAECPSITINNGVGSKTPAITAPSGSRTIITQRMCGNYNVGLGQQFNYISSAMMNLFYRRTCGDVTLLLKDSVYDINNEIQIQNFIINNNDTIYIKPDVGVNSIIRGSVNNNGLIWFIGSRNVVIDGSNNGTNSKNLILSNLSSNGSAIQLDRGSRNNVIKNCIIKGISTDTSFGVVTFGNGEPFNNNGNNFNLIYNNDITSGSSCPLYGILNRGTSNSERNAGNVIKTNRIFNFSGIGIFDKKSSSSNYYLSNEIFNNLIQSSALTGIKIGNPYDSYYNEIENLSISGNFIHDLKTTSNSFVYGIHVINLGDFPATGRNHMANNIISLSETSPLSLIGIYDEADQFSGYKLCNNTVYIGGSVSGASNSQTYFRSFSSSAFLHGNILINTRTGGSGKHYIIKVNDTTRFAASHNTYYNNEGLRNVFARDGFGDLTNLRDWKIVTRRDNNSNRGNPGITSTVFTPNINLPGSWYVSNRSLRFNFVTDDFYGALRPGVNQQPPDGGAIEFPNPNTPPKKTKVNTTALSRYNGIVNRDNPPQTFGVEVGEDTVMSFTLDGNGTNPDSVLISNYPGITPQNISGGKYLLEYWDVESYGGSGYTYSIKLYYDTIYNYNITDPTKLVIARRNGGNWEVYQNSVVDTATMTITVSGLTEFGEFAITQSDEPLPVTLASFTSSVNSRNVTLNWTTSSEINNTGFEVERSLVDQGNIEEWSKIGFIAGHGTTNEPKNYVFNDIKLNKGTYKYRLKQLDFNGNHEYFNLQNDVVVGKPAVFDISQNYPNPSNPKSKIDYQVPFDGKVSITIYDVLGREVVTLINENKLADYYTVEFDGSNLASGIYFYRIIAEGEGQKFVNAKKMVLVK